MRSASLDDEWSRTFPREWLAGRLHHSAAASRRLQSALRVQELHHQLQLDLCEQVEWTMEAWRSSWSLSHLLGQRLHASGRSRGLQLAALGCRSVLTLSSGFVCCGSDLNRLTWLLHLRIFPLASAFAAAAAVVCGAHGGGEWRWWEGWTATVTVCTRLLWSNGQMRVDFKSKWLSSSRDEWLRLAASGK